VNRAAASVTHLAKCILLHSYSRTTASSQLCENKQIAIKQASRTVFGVIN